MISLFLAVCIALSPVLNCPSSPAADYAPGVPGVFSDAALSAPLSFMTDALDRLALKIRRWTPQYAAALSEKGSAPNWEFEPADRRVAQPLHHMADFNPPSAGIPSVSLRAATR